MTYHSLQSKSATSPLAFPHGQGEGLEETRVALELAISRAGGIIAFSRALGVTHQAVSAWRKRCHVPPQRALAIEALFGVDRFSLIQPELSLAFRAA
jgi:DNA-binding transcriptional regulator YiaG